MSVAQYHRGQQDKDSRVQTYDKNEGEYVLKRIRVMKFNTAFNNISVKSWTYKKYNKVINKHGWTQISPIHSVFNQLAKFLHENFCQFH
jgi:hypothetical protein